EGEGVGEGRAGEGGADGTHEVGDERKHLVVGLGPVEPAVLVLDVAVEGHVRDVDQLGHAVMLRRRKYNWISPSSQTRTSSTRRRGDASRCSARTVRDSTPSSPTAAPSVGVTYGEARTHRPHGAIRAIRHRRRAFTQEVPR